MTDPSNDNHLGGAAGAPRGAGTATAAVGAVLGLAVCAPFLQRGWLFLLDWPRGPHTKLPAVVWGLDGGLLAAAPFLAAAWAVGEATDPSVVAWLPVLAAIVVACTAAGALVGGPPGRRIPAGALYAVNPFVFERAYAGQVAFLLGYALLPLAVRSLLRAESAPTWAGRLRPALWFTLLVALAPHFAWLLGVVCAVMLAVSRRRRTLGWLVVLAGAVLAANAYLVLPALGRPPATDVGHPDLVAYRTAGGGALGALGEVAGLHGFWRTEISRPRDDVAAWPLFAAAVLVVAVAGAARGWRGPERRLVAVVGGSGALGAVLALGDLGPTGGLFAWLYRTAPGFEVMREPQKFAALLALAYAVLFGLGAQALASGARRTWAPAAWTVAAVVLAVGTAPTLLWGFGGRVDVGAFPASWREADRLMGDGHERVLFLPWHQYLSFPFTDRVVANPAPFAFRRDVISGDNVELPGLRTASRSTRSAYLEFLYAHGDRLHSFGQLVAPHGVGWVVLAKAVDWRQYAWLDRQADLEKVLDRPEITVYRNTRPVALARRATASVTVADWGELAGLSDTADLSGTAVLARRDGPGPVRAPDSPPPPQSPVAGTDPAERLSPVRYRVAPGPAGWLVLAEPYDAAWRLGDRRGTRLAGGVTGFAVGTGGGEVRFAHWDVVRLSYGLSWGTLGFLALGGLIRRRRGENGSSDARSRRPRPTGG